MSNTPLAAPAGYATEVAIAYSDGSGNAVLVSAANPLPVTGGTGGGGGSGVAAASAPLAGSASTNSVIGPFRPVFGRTVILGLSGTWAGTVAVTRSTDNGTTRLPLTAGGNPWARFTGNCCEAIWDESEAAAALYIEPALTSGTLTYRMGQ